MNQDIMDAFVHSHEEDSRFCFHLGLSYFVHSFIKIIALVIILYSLIHPWERTLLEKHKNIDETLNIVSSRVFNSIVHVEATISQSSSERFASRAKNVLSTLINESF